MNRKIRTWVEISLNDLEHNYREISSRLPDGCQMLGVCKANAYGHGAVLEQTLDAARAAGCTCALLRTVSDVDTWADAVALLGRAAVDEGLERLASVRYLKSLGGKRA